MRIALDLDGTILDARGRQLGLTIDLLGRLGAPMPDADEFWELRRGGLSTRDALLKSGLPQSVAEEGSALWRAQIESDEWLLRDELLPGVDDALRVLEAAGADAFVITARQRPDAVRAQILRLGLPFPEERVHVVSPSDPAPSKAQILREENADLFIGDTDSDWRAAEKAGVRFIAVCCGQRSADALRASGAPQIERDLAGALVAAGLGPR